MNAPARALAACVLMLATLGAIATRAARRSRPLAEAPMPAATAPGVACLGPPGAHDYVVYLHGMDSPAPSPQELQARRELSRLADDLGLRVALPRAPAPCPTDGSLRCWGWSFDGRELAGVLDAARAAADACFPKNATYGLVGFSNGGAALDRLVAACLPHDARWHLSVAAAGPWSASDGRDLSTCGKLRMLVGSRDATTLPAARGFEAWLRSRGADARLDVFEGGHELPGAETRSALRELVGQ